MTAISHLFSIKHSIFSSDNGAFSSFFFDQLTHLSLDSNVCAISCLFLCLFPFQRNERGDVGVNRTPQRSGAGVRLRSR